MKFEQYYALIKKLEEAAAANFASYKRRVLLMISLGYLYIFLLIFLMLLPIILIIGLLIVDAPRLLQIGLWTAKLWWAVIPAAILYFGLLGRAIKSIFTRIPETEGIEITRNDAPKLFDLIDDIADKLRSEKPKKVLVTDDYNASVVTRPTIGMFGSRVELLLGLPLMKAMSTSQFNAVLAHEFGHISGKHGRVSKWSYQMESSWGSILASQDEEGDRFALLYSEFVDWYFPRFRAYSFVLMREQEKEADRNAADLTSVEDLAYSFLVTDATQAHLQKDFWDKIDAEMRASDTPSEKLFSRMMESVATFDPKTADEAIRRSLSVPTDYNDSHPSVADRLRLLGFWNDQMETPKLPEKTRDAADEYFGNMVGTFSATFDRDWSEKAAEGWSATFEGRKNLEERIGELKAKPLNELTADEVVELGYLNGENGDMESARSLFEFAVGQFPDHANAHHFLGATKLNLEDETGIHDLEKAIELNPAGASGSMEVIFSYLRAKGRMDEATRFASQLEYEQELDKLAEQEWNYVDRNNDFSSPEIDFELKDQMEKKIGTFDEIEAIYLVRRTLKSRPEVPNHVMFVKTRKKSRLKNRNDLDASEILQIVTERFDNGQVNYFAVLVGQFDGLETELDRIDGAMIYSRK